MRKYKVKSKAKIAPWLDKELKKSKKKGKKIKKLGDEFYKDIEKRHLPKERKGKQEEAYIQKVAWGN